MTNPARAGCLIIFLHSDATGAEAAYRLEQIWPESAQIRRHKSSTEDKEETVGAKSELISG